VLVSTLQEADKASDRLLLAEGLEATYVTRSAASPADMLAFWPNSDSPTHLIFCIEGGRESGEDGTVGMNSGVQRIEIASGTVETVVYGTDRCDGIRTTEWGTILATEETDMGLAFEIIDPLKTTGAWIESRESGIIRTEMVGLRCPRTLSPALI
jgi:hypothetical protein